MALHDTRDARREHATARGPCPDDTRHDNARGLSNHGNRATGPGRRATPRKNACARRRAEPQATSNLMSGRRSDTGWTDAVPNRRAARAVSFGGRMPPRGPRSRCMRRRPAAADSRHRFARTGALICHAFDVHVFSCPPDSRVGFAQPPLEDRTARRSTRTHPHFPPWRASSIPDFQNGR